MRCINCGWDNQPGATACIKCGQQLDPSDNNEQAAPNQPQAAMPPSFGMQQQPMPRPTVVGMQQQPAPRPTVVGVSNQPEPRPTTVIAPGELPQGMPRPTVVNNMRQQPQIERATVSVPAEQLVKDLVQAPPTPNIPEGNNSSCPGCGYPLVGSPATCPACGFQLSNSQHESKPASGAPVPPPVTPKMPDPINRQTVVGDFGHHFIPEEPAVTTVQEITPKCSLTLIPEETETAPSKKNDYEGDTIILNRDNTEPDNRTITSREQAVLSYADGQWFIEDRSDLKSTFIRVSRKTALQPGDVIVLGDRRFTFNEE